MERRAPRPVRTDRRAAPGSAGGPDRKGRRTRGRATRFPSPRSPQATAVRAGSTWSVISNRLIDSQQIVLLIRRAAGAGLSAKKGLPTPTSALELSASGYVEFDMPRDGNGNGGGNRRAPSRNVLGERLESCSIKPMTGFFR